MKLHNQDITGQSEQNHIRGEIEIDVIFIQLGTSYHCNPRTESCRLSHPKLSVLSGARVKRHLVSDESNMADAVPL